MTTYACPAACAHCLYCSAPGLGGFMEFETAHRIAGALRRMGAFSVHIGGGEPFLNRASLRETIRALRDNRIGIDYIETNAFWINDEAVARDLVKELGAPIMVSVDPFHIEHIPLNRPLRLIRLLEDMRWDYFVWQDRYLKKLMPLDHARPVPRSELKSRLGESYLIDAAREYGLCVNGRALTILRDAFPLRRAEELLDDSPCNLLNGSHCHIDHFGNFVPPGCPGIGIAIEDVESGVLDPDKYPAATRLIKGGILSLWEYAEDKGFEPDPAGYASACELCYFLREFLERTTPSADIAPACFYESMRKTYAQP